MRIGLVGCVKQKLPVVAPAQDLYVSPLFRRRWSSEVLNDLRSQLGDLGQHTFEVHAGSEYRDHGLHADLVAGGATVEIPTAELGLGSQLAFYGSGSDPGPDSSAQPQALSPEQPARSGRGSYAPLGDCLSSLHVHEVRMTFAEIEQILGRSLPGSARRHRAWWATSVRVPTHMRVPGWTRDGGLMPST